MVGSLTPRSVQAAETELTTSLLRVVPVSQNGSVVGFDLWAEGKVVAPIRLSSNGLITASSALVTTSGTSQTLAIGGLRCKPGAGVVFAPSDFVSVTVTEGEKYPVVHFQLTLVKFDPVAWKAVAGNCPFHFLTCSIPDATIWQQQGWGMATPKLDPYTLQLDDDNGNWQVATKYNRDWSYVVPMGASPIPVIGLWAPDSSHYVGFFFEGARLTDHTEPYIAASYCWKQGADNQFITLASPYGGSGYQTLVYPTSGDTIASWFDLLWSWDMPAWKEPNQLCQDVTFSKYQALLPTVPQQNDLGWVPGGVQKASADVWRADPWWTLSYRTIEGKPRDSFESWGIEPGSLFVYGFGTYGESNIQAAFNTHNTAAIAAQKKDLLYLLSMSQWVTLGGESCLTWEEPLEGDWKPGYVPGNKNMHTSDWWAIGSYMIDMYRNDHDPSWLPYIDGMYNWTRQYLYTRNDFHDVPSSPFGLASSLVCPFLVDYFNTFQNDSVRAVRAQDALTMARSYMYRSMVMYLGDNDPDDSLDPSFLTEDVSGKGWTGSVNANEMSETMDTMALVYTNSGDARFKYALRGILERYYQLYKEQTLPVNGISAYPKDSLTEDLGVFDGSYLGRDGRTTWGTMDPLTFCFPIGSSSMQILCGAKAAITFDKGTDALDITDYRCDTNAGFSFRIVGGNGTPFDASLTYPQKDIHTMTVRRTRGGRTIDLKPGTDVQTYADAPWSLRLYGVKDGDIITVGDVTNAVSCQPADLPLTESVLTVSTTTDNYCMLALPSTTGVSVDWNNNDSWAGLLPGKQNAWGVPYYIQPPTLAPGKVAVSGSIQLPSVVPEYTDAYVIYSPAATKDNVSLAFADSTSMTYTDIPVSVWHSWPENFHQRLVMAHFSFAPTQVPVRVEAGANLVFAVTLGKNITPTQLSWYNNGLAAAKTQAAIDEHYAALSGLVASRIGDRRIAIIPPIARMDFFSPELTFYRLGGISAQLDVLTEQQLVDPNVFNAAIYPVALYMGIEDYIRTVTTDGDGEQAIQRYLSQGGVLVFAASTGGPWPMYYPIDKGVKGTGNPLLPRLGIPMYGPWESPPGPLTVDFSSNQDVITGLPASFPFPTSGNPMLRLADLTRVGSDVSITPILTIDGLGSPAFLAKFASGPMKGGQVLYIWSTFLEQDYAHTLYDGVIRFIANQYTAAPASLTATVTDNKVILSWPAGTPGNRAIAGYSISKSDTSGTYPSTPVATVDASTLTWTDSAPTAGTNAYYIVRAIDAGTPTRTSGASPEASVITGFRISAASSAHGSLGVPQTLVPRGSSATVPVHPAQGWKLATLLDNNTDVTRNVTTAGYTIADIQADHVLRATFDRIPDTTGPTITVTAPSSTSDWDTMISGSVTDDLSGVASLTVQGSPVTILSDGTFSATVHLSMGSNTIALQAVDVAGNSTKKQVAITRVLPTTTVEVTIDSNQMLVNGEAVFLEASPIIIHGRTMLPIRALIEALGGTVEWDPSLHAITLTLGSSVVALTVGKNTADVGGQAVKLDVPPTIANGRTLVPLRFVAENLGCQVTWDVPTRTATVVWQG
jgi:hypothetical protein